MKTDNRLGIALIGIGNILLSDEGAGVHAVNKIRGSWSFSPEIEIIDGGTLGLDLLPYFEKYSRIMILDAVDFGKEPGYIAISENNEILNSFNKKLSVHNMGLADILFACQLMGIKPLEIILIGIQPKSMDIGLEMTDEVSSKIPDLIQIALENLQRWNVKCVLLSRQR